MGRALPRWNKLLGNGLWCNRHSKDGVRWSNYTQLPKEEKTQLPKPQAILEVQNVVVLAPGQQSACLKNINFKFNPGQACGVIGPSGAGKSSLAKLIKPSGDPFQAKYVLTVHH